MITNSIGKIFKPNIIKHAVTQLGIPGALLPVAILEVTVDTGRGYNAYKRGGGTEFRERTTEDVSAGIFWLFGPKVFNNIGNKIGEKFLGIKKANYSLGKDKARFGMEQALAANRGVSKAKLAAFKFGKVVSSIALSIAIIGWGLPKLNQAITRKKLAKKNQEKINMLQKENIINNAKKLFNDFNDYKKSKNLSKPAFGKFFSAETIGKIAHNLEHNATWQLGSTDGGILVGRTTNAWKRSHEEAIEYGFRDLASSYFYLWATGHTFGLLNKLDKYKGKNTQIDPISAVKVNNYLAEILNGKSMSVEKFKSTMFGLPDNKKFELVKDTLVKNKGNISVNEFIRLTKADAKLAKKAKLMSKFQPKINGVSILTDTQVADILSSGKITDPKFLYRTISEYYGNPSKKLFGKLKGRITIKSLKDKLGFIDAEAIEKRKNYIFNYVESVIEMAQRQAAKTGKPAEITIDLLKKVSKRNAVLHSIYLGAGFGVSILFLSTLIPKMQYWITKIRTGKDGFPGVDGQNKAA